MDPLYIRTLRHGNTRNNVIWKGLRKIIVSEDRDFYTFFLKLYPFISSNNIFNICLDKYEITSSDPTTKNKARANNVIDFLIHAYKNELLDKSTFDMSRVKQVMSENHKVEKLIRVATSRNIYLNAVDVCNSPNVKNFNLMLVESNVIAEKLSYICSHYYIKIKVYDLVKYVRNASNGKQDVSEDYHNITKLVDIFNKISAWVPTTIIRYPEKKHQEKLVKKFVEIAEECRKLNNYHILMAIYAGLNNTAISRLTFLWQKQKYNKRIKEIADLMTPIDNFKVYRAELETVILQNSLDVPKIEGSLGSRCIPCMPYLGTIISDFQHMLETDPIDISNKCFIHDSLETILIMINRFLKTQKLYGPEYKHPEIGVIFDKLIIWPDEKLYEISKNIYLFGKKNPLIKKSKSTNALSRSSRKSIESNDSADSLESMDSYSSVSNMSNVSIDSIANTEVLPRRPLMPMHSVDIIDVSLAENAKLPPPIVPPKLYHNSRPRSATVSNSFNKANVRPKVEPQVRPKVRPKVGPKLANKLNRTQRYKSMPTIVPQLD